MGGPVISAIRLLPLASPRTFFDGTTIVEASHENKVTRSAQVRATAAHRRGIVAPQPCKTCREGNLVVKFSECVTLDGYLGGRCTNCAFQDCASRRCIWDTAAPSPLLPTSPVLGPDTDRNDTSRMRGMVTDYPEHTGPKSSDTGKPSAAPMKDSLKIHTEKMLCELLGKKPSVPKPKLSQISLTNHSDIHKEIAYFSNSSLDEPSSWVWKFNPSDPSVKEHWPPIHVAHSQGIPDLSFWESSRVLTLQNLIDEDRVRVSGIWPSEDIQLPSSTPIGPNKKKKHVDTKDRLIQAIGK